MPGVIIQGKAYGWNRFEVSAGGINIPFFGITKLSWKETSKGELLYGKGDVPQDIGDGERGFEGGITLWYSDYLAWKATLPPGASLTQTRFDLTFCFVETTAIIINRFRSIKFTEISASNESKNMNVLVEMPFIALMLEENID